MADDKELTEAFKLTENNEEKVLKPEEVNTKRKKKKVSKQKNKSITMEIFSTLKNVMIFQWIVIGFLILLNAAQSFYHDYKWSQFDTVVVDSKDGGNANYIGNDGDIIYGEGDSSQETEK